MQQPPADEVPAGPVDGVRHTRDTAEVVAAIDRLAGDLQRSLRILSRDGDPALYDRDAFIDLLAGFVQRRSRVARIRLLLADPARCLRDGHALVRFWHRFPSFCEVRELRGEDLKIREALFIADERNLVRRADAGHPHTQVIVPALPLAAEKAAWFDQVWERSPPSAQLRRLTL